MGIIEILKGIVEVAGQAIAVLGPCKDGISFMLICAIIGAFMAQRVFTKTAHWARRPVWFWWWGRKTLPLQPILAGGAWGLLFVEAGETPGASMLHFMAWGGGSVILWEIAKHLAAKRGINVELPGGD